MRGPFLAIFWWEYVESSVVYQISGLKLFIDILAAHALN
jgi:hypothetical protein